MESSKGVSYCGPGCHLLQMHNSSPSLSRFHVDDEHVAKDDEYVKAVAAKLYGPLFAQQYRILEILPGRKRSSLKCRLLRATLTPVDGARLDDGSKKGSLVEYDALSYCWGSPARTCSVVCNGTNVPITPDLKNALHSLRHRYQARYVWTDALCINQLGGAKEKGEQVQLMFTIFRKARRVIGWLGSSKEKCKYEDLFACLHFGSIRQLSEVSNPYQLNQFYSQADDPICDCVLRNLKECTVEFVRQDPWFERTWIRQEVFAAREIEMKYGPFCFNIRMLIQLIKLVDDTYSRPDLQRFHKLVERHSGHIQARTFYNSEIYGTAKSTTARWLKAALSNAQGFKATEDQDLIFALQNIAQPEDTRRQLLFQTIDYGMSSHELFEQFIKRLVSLKSSLNLAPVSILEDRTDFQTIGLPSWVTDWRKDKTRLARLGLEYCLPRSHDLDTSQPGVLSMDGVLLGTVDDDWSMDDYQNSLSRSLGKDNRPFPLASQKIYRSRASSLSGHAPFTEISTIIRVLDEIAYRPYRYAMGGLTVVDSQRQPYVLASAIVQPGDILVSFAWKTALLTVFGYERATWCSVLRECPNRPDSHYFLGPCVFAHLNWYEPDLVDWRAPPMGTKKYNLV